MAHPLLVRAELCEQKLLLSPPPPAAAQFNSEQVNMLALQAVAIGAASAQQRTERPVPRAVHSDGIKPLLAELPAAVNIEPSGQIPRVALQIREESSPQPVPLTSLASSSASVQSRAPSDNDNTR